MSKKIIITGAAGGIGAAAVKELRSRGADVVGLDLNTDSDPSLIACDVTDQDSVDSAVAEGIERLGGLDVLINNAGIGLPQSAGLRPGKDGSAVIEVNLMGPWRVTGAALDALRSAPSGRGRVVNIASGLAFLTVPFATAYTMSKRGIVAYSDSLRLEHGDALDVTTVYPGYIKTPIHEASAQDGFELDGIVPEETVEDAARCLARAALGRPVRDLGTTTLGDLEYRLLRGAPRRALDAGTMIAMKRAVKKGQFERSKMAREFVGRLQRG